MIIRIRIPYLEWKDEVEQTIIITIPASSISTYLYLAERTIAIRTIETPLP